MASKEVSIMRRRPGVSILPDMVVDGAVTKLSSQFRFGRPLKGLTKEEEKKYLPLLKPLDQIIKPGWQIAIHFGLNFLLW